MSDLGLSDALSDDDDGIAEAPVDPSAAASASQTKRGRGRPVGSVGSRFLREIWKEEAHQNELANPEPQPGDIAYARQVRAKNVLARQKQKEELGLSQMKVPVLARDGCAALESYAPQSCLKRAALGLPLHMDLHNALLKTINVDTDTCSDSLVQLQLEGAMSGMSFKAFDKVVGNGDTNNTNTRVLAVASAIFELTIFFWSALLFMFAEAEATIRPILLLVVRVRYDETPTRVRLKDPQLKEGNTVSKDHAAAFQQLSVDQLVEQNVLGSETSSDYAKIFQIELCIGALVYDVGRCRYVWTFGQLPTALYGLESTNGRNTFLSLQDAIQSLPEYEKISQKSQISIRHSCSDRYTANTTAEKYLCDKYRDVTLVHLYCDIHRLFSCVKGSMSVVERDVSGCLAFAFAFGEAGGVPKMRRELARILLKQLEIIYDKRPEGDIQKHQQQVLDTFLPTKNVSPARAKLNRKRRFILSYYLTGAWWQKGIVSHHCEYSCCSSPESTFKGIAIFVAWALIPHRCPVFPRSRWTRSDESVDFLGLLASVHSLLEPLVINLTGGRTKLKMLHLQHWTGGVRIRIWRSWQKMSGQQ